MRPLKWLRNALIAVSLGFNKATGLSTTLPFSKDENVEPERQQDEWEKLMTQYTSGTPEQQAEAERILLGDKPEDKLERDKIFMAKWATKNTFRSKLLPKRRGRKFGSASIEELHELSEQNAREQEDAGNE